MKLTRTRLKQIIKEELQGTLRENRVKSVEATSIEDAELLMDPKYRVWSHSGPMRASTYESDTQVYIVTLADGTKIIAETFDNDIWIYDRHDREINDESLEQEILTRIKQ